MENSTSWRVYEYAFDHQMVRPHIELKARLFSQFFPFRTVGEMSVENLVNKLVDSLHDCAIMPNTEHQ